jgi:exodeoxyribonuclease V alpha subunit
LGLVNGEEVTVKGIDDEITDSGKTITVVTVKSIDTTARVPLSELTASHAYALTVHKSQGSEYPCAIVVVHRSHQFSLTRRLVYTAATRAKELLIFIGEHDVLRRAVGNTREDTRRTALVERLQ